MSQLHLRKLTCETVEEMLSLEIFAYSWLYLPSWGKNWIRLVTWYKNSIKTEMIKVKTETAKIISVDYLHLDAHTWPWVESSTLTEKPETACGLNTQTARWDLRMKAESNQFDIEVTIYVKCRTEALICLRSLSENKKCETSFKC